MRICVTGATGYVGSYVLRALLDHDHTPRCVVRESPSDLAVDDPAIECAQGDVTDRASLDEAVEGCDAIIHLVGIIEESPSRHVTFERIHVDGTRNVVRAAQEAGITHFIHMSANGARPDDATPYQRTKWEAEQIVKDASFNHWTIFRPSLLFGAPDPNRPEFASELLDALIRPFPILPVFGNGAYELQPVHVSNVAEAFVQSVTQKTAHQQTYVAAGPDRLPYTEVLDRITRGAGLDLKPKVHVPIFLARLGVHTIGRLGALPISMSQFEMLVEGNTGNHSAFVNDFDLTLVRFTPSNLKYLRAV